MKISGGIDLLDGGFPEDPWQQLMAVGRVARAECRSTLAAAVALAAIVVVAATIPAKAEWAPFSQAVIDAAKSEPDLAMPRVRPAPALPIRRSSRSAPAIACSGRRRRSIFWR